MILTIIGRRWFRRGPGNTYCTATVHIDGVFVLKTPMQGGYGDHYRDVALEALELAGKIPPITRSSNGGREAIWSWAERNGITVHYEAIDVAREKDL